MWISCVVNQERRTGLRNRYDTLADPKTIPFRIHSSSLNLTSTRQAHRSFRPRVHLGLAYQIFVSLRLGRMGLFPPFYLPGHPPKNQLIQDKVCVKIICISNKLSPSTVYRTLIAYNTRMNTIFIEIGHLLLIRSRTLNLMLPLFPGHRTWIHRR